MLIQSLRTIGVGNCIDAPRPSYLRISSASFWWWLNCSTVKKYHKSFPSIQNNSWFNLNYKIKICYTRLKQELHKYTKSLFQCWTDIMQNETMSVRNISIPCNIHGWEHCFANLNTFNNDFWKSISGNTIHSPNPSDIV